MKNNSFTLSPNEWLVMEQLWKQPSTLMARERLSRADIEALYGILQQAEEREGSS